MNLKKISYLISASFLGLMTLNCVLALAWFVAVERRLDPTAAALLLFAIVLGGLCKMLVSRALAEK